MVESGMNSVFIHIARTGGTTISTVLGLDRYISRRRLRHFKQSGQIYIGHLKYHQLISGGLIDRDFDQTAFKFAFARNPYDRAVSQFLHCKQKNEVPRSLTFEGFCGRLTEFYRVCHPQSVYLEKVSLDFLGRFENFVADLKRVADILGKKIREIPRLNAIGHDRFEKYHTDVTVSQINDFYGEDFDLLGYEKCPGTL